MATKILIVEDDSNILEALVFFLKKKNFEAVGVTTPQNIVNLMHSYKPDVLLIDLFLSGYNGAEVINMLKTEIKDFKFKTILTSAHPQAIVAKEYKEVDEFISKPFDLNLLIEKIQSLSEKADAKS